MDEHLWLTLAIPAAFLLITGVVKCLVRNRVAWDNFYLGLDAALAALANGIVNVVDIVRVGSGLSSEAREQRIVSTAAFIFIAFSLLLFVMVIHQYWEASKVEPQRAKRRWWRAVWLGVIGNFIGTGALLIFIYGRLKGYL